LFDGNEPFDSVLDRFRFIFFTHYFARFARIMYSNGRLQRPITSFDCGLSESQTDPEKEDKINESDTPKKILKDCKRKGVSSNGHSIGTDDLATATDGHATVWNKNAYSNHNASDDKENEHAGMPKHWTTATSKNPTTTSFDDKGTKENAVERTTLSSS